MNTQTAVVHKDALDSWFDEDGFLAEAGHWNAELAEQVARAYGLGDLTQKHWEIIESVRRAYFAKGTLPVMRLVCRKASIDRQKAHRLFGDCKGLWRVAGLPNPGEEARAYMN